jgi:hypothetical protein
MRKLSVPEKGKLPVIRFGVYGQPGDGKTTLLAGVPQHPDLAPTLWLDIAGNPDNHLDKIPYAYGLDTATDLLSALDYLCGGQKEVHPFRKLMGDNRPEQPFRSLVIDTFTEFQHLLINDVTGQEIDALQKKLDIFKLPEAEATRHGKSIKARTLNTARKALVVLQLHTFIAFQEYETVSFQAEGGRIAAGAKTMQIDLYGASRTALPAYLNLMGRIYWMDGFEKQEYVRGGKTRTKDVAVTYPVIRWQDSDSQAKNQLAAGHLGTETKRPTIEMIVTAIKNKHGVE